MACGIGLAHKLFKQNRDSFYNTNDTHPAPSTTSYSYEMFNENTNITSK